MTLRELAKRAGIPDFFLGVIETILVSRGLELDMRVSLLVDANAQMVRVEIGEETILATFDQINGWLADDSQSGATPTMAGGLPAGTPCLPG